MRGTGGNRSFHGLYSVKERLHQMPSSTVTFQLHRFIKMCFPIEKVSSAPDHLALPHSSFTAELLEEAAGSIEPLTTSSWTDPASRQRALTSACRGCSPSHIAGLQAKAVLLMLNVQVDFYILICHFLSHSIVE